MNLVVKNRFVFAKNNETLQASVSSAATFLSQRNSMAFFNKEEMAPHETFIGQTMKPVSSSATSL